MGSLLCGCPALLPASRAATLPRRRRCRVGLAELGGQERLDEVPGHGRPHGPATHTNDVHVIVLDPLPGREVVVDQRGADALNLVGTDRRAHTAAADRHAALHRPRRHSPGERDDEVGIVVVLAQRCAPKSTTSCPAARELGEQFLLQTEIHRDRWQFPCAWLVSSLFRINRVVPSPRTRLPELLRHRSHSHVIPLPLTIFIRRSLTVLLPRGRRAPGRGPDEPARLESIGSPSRKRANAVGLVTAGHQPQDAAGAIEHRDTSTSSGACP